MLKIRKEMIYMRSKIIKTSLEIPVNINKPDENGVFYTEDAIINACNNANNQPIIMYLPNGESKVVGIANNVRYESGNILVDGTIFYGGTEESVLFDDNKKIVSMSINGFGISE
jgi:hypothetical protein